MSIVDLRYLAVGFNTNPLTSNDVKTAFIYPFDVVGRLKEIILVSGSEPLCDGTIRPNVVLWKLSNPLPYGSSTDEKDFHRGIRSIQFPHPDSYEALDGNGVVQVLQLHHTIKQAGLERPIPGKLNVIIVPLDRCAKLKQPYPMLYRTFDGKGYRRKSGGTMSFRESSEMQDPKSLLDDGLLPVSIYHECFSKFHEVMDDPSWLPNAKMCHLVQKLFVASAKKYPTSWERMRRTISTLCQLLDSHLESFRNGDSRTIDFTDMSTCNYETRLTATLIGEVRAEESERDPCPPEHLGSAYRRFFSQRDAELARSKSCCPSFILSICGPTMCVLGGVFINVDNQPTPIVERFTDNVNIGGYFSKDSDIQKVARIFHAISVGMKCLKTYKSHVLDSKLGSPPPGQVNPPWFSPYLQSFRSETLTYTKHFLEGELQRLCPMFEAITNGPDRRTVVVKFVRRYNGSAHRLLAEFGLAPDLVYDGTTDDEAPNLGGVYMIVMDRVLGIDFRVARPLLNEGHMSIVERAVDILHSHNFVFGDLRGPNILLERLGGGGVKLVDFDWCGKDGEGRYPAGMNVDDLSWPEGEIMRKEHDMVMLDRLRKK